MHDLSRVGWKPLALLLVLGGDEREELSQLSQRFLAGRHEGVTARNRRNLRDPTIRLVPVEHYFVVLERHRFPFYG